jgi:hypothetical protein
MRFRRAIILGELIFWKWRSLLDWDKGAIVLAVESAILIIQTLKLRLFWESAIALHTLKI